MYVYPDKLDREGRVPVWKKEQKHDITQHG